MCCWSHCSWLRWRHRRIDCVGSRRHGGGQNAGVQAALTLALLTSTNADNKVRIAVEGGIGVLIALVRDGTAKGKTNAAIALYNRSSNNAGNQKTIRDAGLPIIEAAMNQEPDATAKGEMQDLLSKIKN